MDAMVRFGRCSVDVARRSVELDGEARHLEPQAFDLLAYLLENRDRVIAKSELLDAVWGDQFVSESALTTRIKEIRQALGDDGTRQTIIRNFRGRGYRFVAEIDDRPDGPRSPAEPPTQLVGRDRDIDESSAMLRTSRLVTIVGPGGVGKTALANELARRAGGRHTDGVAVVRLAEVSDPASVTHLLRRDTSLFETGPGDDDLMAALAALDALVIVDNCEHVLDEISRIVSGVLSRDGNVTFLATSRERLGVAGEQIWPLAPLDGGAARLLLLERARRVQPGFDWHDGDESDVERILEALDRLPLGIEMAAARLPTFGVGELAQVLTSRLDLLRSADRRAVERHRTIDALIGWSEGLLSDDERALLATMSVFAGAVPVVDIAAVAGADATELATGPLAGLVDKSLVVADITQRPTRYRLLHTVRACASHRRPPSVDAVHARYITDVAATADRLLRTPGEASAAARLDALVAEIRTAHAWARVNDHGLAGELTAALLWYAHERQWTEPASWARALSPDLDTHGDAALAVAASLAADASNRGDYDEAEGLAARAVASSDPRIAGSALETLSDVGLYTGDLGSARRHARALLDLGTSLGDRALQTFGVVGEVLAAVYDGRPADGQAVLDRHDTATGLGPTCAAWIAYVAGEVLSALGRHGESIERFETATRLATSVGSHFVASVAEVSSLAASSRTGDIAAALVAFRPRLVTYRQMRSDSHAITTIRNLIEALVRAGRYQPAMELLGAVSKPDLKSTYGAESERLDEARATAIEQVGSELVESWTARGAVRDLSWALDHAIDTLDATVFGDDRPTE
jgi:predicted ATPase/DNA-binding winged helix-turn-helix (wHTH) protein